MFQVAGTIVTYELVLVQFNAVQQIEQSNFTMVCEIKWNFTWKFYQLGIWIFERPHDVFGEYRWQGKVLFNR